MRNVVRLGKGERTFSGQIADSNDFSPGVSLATLLKCDGPTSPCSTIPILTVAIEAKLTTILRQRIFTAKQLIKLV